MARNEKNAPQEPLPPLDRGAKTYGERRPPDGDPKHYDKHGGNLDHDGKRAKTQEPPRERQQKREDEGHPTRGMP